MTESMLPFAEAEGRAERPSQACQCEGGLATWCLTRGARIESPARLVEAFGQEALLRGLRLRWVIASVQPLRRGEPLRCAWGRPPAPEPLAEEGFASWLERCLSKLGPAARPHRLRTVEGGAGGTSRPSAGLRRYGVTDCLVQALPPGAGGEGAGWLCLATEAPEGFRDDEVAHLEEGAGALSVLLELGGLRAATQRVCSTWAGRYAGHLALEGLDRPGAVSLTEEVVWYCDMRSYTEHGQGLSPETMLDLLNDYLACVGGAIEAHGGEIIRFLGDAVLATFRARQHPSGMAGACGDAVLAAREAIARVERLNVERARKGLRAIRFDIALSAGEVCYGALGTPSRLDFTVVGLAVNLAGRIEALCAQLGEQVLVSDSFARASGMALRPLGAYRVKGFPEPQAVHGL